MEAVASLGIGRLIDLRMPPRYIICATNILQCGITLSFPHVSTTPRAIAMGITRGIYQGTMEAYEVQLYRISTVDSTWDEFKACKVL